MYGCYAPRSFLTREEKIEMMVDYQETLEKELAGVKEMLSEMKKEKV